MKKIFRFIAALAAIGFAFLAYVWLTLPDVRALKTMNPSTTAFMQLRQREAQAEGKELRHYQVWVPYSRISQNLKRAVLVAEDDAFWEHEGVDMEQLKITIQTDIARGKAVRGGSTITQQLAKNLYLSPSRDPVRKLRELIITRRLEAELSKQRIFELYLNEIEWGDGIWGAEAAARSYFGSSAASLTREQAAILAGAIINPRVYSPAHPNARLLRRQQIILSRMGGYTPPPTIPVVNNQPQPSDGSVESGVEQATAPESPSTTDLQSPDSTVTPTPTEPAPASDPAAPAESNPQPQP